MLVPLKILNQETPILTPINPNTYSNTVVKITSRVQNSFAQIIEIYNINKKRVDSITTFLIVSPWLK